MNILSAIRMAAVRLNSTDPDMIAGELKKAGFLYTEQLLTKVLTEIDAERIEGQVSYVSVLPEGSRTKILNMRAR